MLTAVEAGWDANAAEAVLAKVNARLDRALAEESRAQSHRNLIDAFRFVITNHARKRDPLLFAAMAWLENEIAKWEDRPRLTRQVNQN